MNIFDRVMHINKILKQTRVELTPRLFTGVSEVEILDLQVTTEGVNVYNFIQKGKYKQNRWLELDSYNVEEPQCIVQLHQRLKEIKREEKLISKKTPNGVRFLGEQSAEGFITGNALAEEIGLIQGEAQHSDAGWLHFELDGKTIYVAKKPFRSHISWDHINTVGAVFGTRTVVINGDTYKVRLLKGTATDRHTGSTNGIFDPIEVYESEWNRLMYPIHSPKHSDTRNPSPVSGEGIQFGSLASYSDIELVTHSNEGNGSQNWCQETPMTSPTGRVYRGNIGVSNLSWSRASQVVSGKGWRPVLELVE